jgi:hypothetical protein
MKTILLSSLAIVALASLVACSAERASPPPQAETMTKIGDAIHNVIANATNTVDGGGTIDPDAIGKQLNTAVFPNGSKAPGSKLPVNSRADAEKLTANLAGIRDLVERANAAWKLEHYREAAMLYRSVAMATVTGSEQFVSEARDRLNELDSIARKRLDAAADAGLHNDYAAQARELLGVIAEFPDIAAGREAEHLLGALRSHPASAASLELEEARTLQAQGRIFDAITRFEEIAANPRYRERNDCEAVCLQAKRLAQEFTKNDVLRMAIATQRAAKDDRQARALLASAQNLLLNKMAADAKDKLKTIVTTYPNSPVAGEAKKLLDELK